MWGAARKLGLLVLVLSSSGSGGVVAAGRLSGGRNMADANAPAAAAGGDQPAAPKKKTSVQFGAAPASNAPIKRGMSRKKTPGPGAKGGNAFGNDEQDDAMDTTEGDSATQQAETGKQ